MTGAAACLRAADRAPLVRRGATRRRVARRLLPFALLAIGVHLLAVAGVVEGPRLAALLVGAPRPHPPSAPPPPATIALIEEDTPTVGGSRPTKAARPDVAPDPRAVPRPAPTPLTSPDATDRAAAAAGADTGTVAAKAAPAPKAPATPAPPQAAAPEVNLDIPGQPGTGLVSGPNVVPASPADGHVNAPPGYPREAALRHEQGAVGLIVHVAPDGHAQSVEIAASSGYKLLDDTARRAVARWHFRPATRDGHPVASLFNEEIDFSLEPPPS